MTTPELLPCPFCGKEPWGVFGPMQDAPEKERFGYRDDECWVECHGGNDGTGSGSLCGDWYYCGTREETRAAWNRRAPPVAIAHEAVDPLPFYRGLVGWRAKIDERITQVLHDQKWNEEELPGSRRLLMESIELLAATPTASDRPVVRTVIDEIAAERQRQISGEGWTREHDDAEHYNGELARAAAAYLCASVGCAGYAKSLWPWDDFKDKGARRNYIVGAALIVAEIERRDRAATPTASDRPVVRAEWISVEERLPAVMESVLVAADDGGIYVDYRYQTPEGQEPYWHTVLRATHWMPLPDAPADRAAPPSGDDRG